MKKSCYNEFNKILGGLMKYTLYNISYIFVPAENTFVPVVYSNDKTAMMRLDSKEIFEFVHRPSNMGELAQFTAETLGVKPSSGYEWYQNLNGMKKYWFNHEHDSILTQIFMFKNYQPALDDDRQFFKDAKLSMLTLASIIKELNAGKREAEKYSKKEELEI